MNKTYKLVWNRVAGVWQVGSELAKGRKKAARTGAGLLAVLLGSLQPVYAAPAASTLPIGESVVSGTAGFDRSMANQLTVNQSTSKLITNWNSFDVGSSGKVVFAQPDASSIALNRITTGTASQIFGQLDANGQVFIVNPAGITFGAGSQVNVGGLLASTLNIKDSDFLSGDLRFARDRANGKVSNEGSLNASSGNVVLLSPTVLSQGSITANAGNIFVVSADGVRVQDNNAIVSQAPLSTSVVRQSGVLSATSLASGKGKIMLIADKNHVKSEMKVEGDISAQNIWIKGKDITLTADLNLRGNAALEANGSIIYTIYPYSGSVSFLNFLPDGDTGQLRLLSLSCTTTCLSELYPWQLVMQGDSNNPQLLRVNSDVYKVVSTIQQLQDIGLNSNSLKDHYVLGRSIDAAETASWNSGAGFNPIGANGTPFSGLLDGLGHHISNLNINRPGQDRVGLFAYVNGASIKRLGIEKLNIKGRNDVAALAGVSRNSTISHVSINSSYGCCNMFGLSGVDRVGALAGFSIDSQVSDIDVLGGLVASGLRAGGLIGYNRGGGIDGVNLNGRIMGKVATVGGLIGYSENALIQNADVNTWLYANSQSSDFPQKGKGGLVGYLASGEIRNSEVSARIDQSSEMVGGMVGVNHGSIIDSSSAGFLEGTVRGGGLVAENYGLIQRSHAAVSVRGGGLVYTNNGVIEDSYYSVAEEQTTIGSVIGGLVAYNNGLIERSYVQASLKGLNSTGQDVLMGGLVAVNNATGVISYSWMQGNLTSTGRYVGGLVGSNYGTVNNSTAQGAVQGWNDVGGAVGINQAGAIIDNVQTSNSVKGKQNIGGLVGSNTLGAAIINSTATGSVSGIGNAGQALGGLVGLNAGQITQAQSSATVSGISKVGGLVGENSGQISQASASGAVNAKDVLGGLAGLNLGHIGDSFASSTVSGTNIIGGLAGQNGAQTQDNAVIYGVIDHSYATGAVSGEETLGGLVGDNAGEINRSYATGNLNGRRYIGGLVGSNSEYTDASISHRGAINDSYARGKVQGLNVFGGLAGQNAGDINRSYFSGLITNNGNGGGLVGFGTATTGVVNQSYWDVSRTGLNSSDGGTGLSSQQMKQASSYAGWDISADAQGSSVWYIHEGVAMPVLR